MANGSLAELENQLQIAFDLEYISIKDFEVLTSHCKETGRLLNSLIKSTSKRQHFSPAID